MDKSNLAKLIEASGEQVYQEYAEPKKLKKELKSKIQIKTKSKNKGR